MGKKEPSKRIVLATMHRACFDGTEPPVWAYFLRITNLSEQDIWMTHVGMDCRGKYIAAEQPERLLPKKLKPNEPWETWIEFDKLPSWIHDNPFRHGQVTLSTGQVIKTKQGTYIPPRGNVPGGPLRPEYSNPPPRGGPFEADAKISEQQEQQILPNYDIQQVCESGHKITGCYTIKQEERQEFCKKCGAKTIIACPNCYNKIQGDRIGKDWKGVSRSEKRVFVPSYCPNCGKPYPWTENKIITAIQTLTEFGDLNEEEKKTIKQDVENIANDVPETELSARRLKRIWERGKSVGYEAIMEFASRTAAKILKGP